MMPNGGQWNTNQQWFTPSPTFVSSTQVHGVTDMNAFQMLASQQFSVYGAGVIPAWGFASQQWPQQWQPQFPTNNWTNNYLPNTQPPPPPPPPLASDDMVPKAPPLPPPVASDNHLSEEEKVFDAQFKEWEEKFKAWKEENKNHPDKKSLAAYDAQWETWREQLIQNRERLRKQREERANQSLISSSNDGLKVLANGQVTQSANNGSNSQMKNPPFQPFQQNSSSSCTPGLNAHSHSSEQAMHKHFNQTRSDNDFDRRGNHSFSGPPFHPPNHTLRSFNEDYDRRRYTSHSADDGQLNQTSDQPLRPLYNHFEPDQNKADLIHPRPYQQASDFHDSRQRLYDNSSSKNRNQNYSHDHRTQPLPSPNQREYGHSTEMQPPDSRIPEGYHNASAVHGRQHYFESECPSSATSNESAANLFRQRALQGKAREQRFAPYNEKRPPINVDSRELLENSVGDNHIRMRTEDSFSLSGQEKDNMSLLEGSNAFVTYKDNYIKPLVFEYNHRPGRNGRFAVPFVTEPVAIEYSHGKLPCSAKVDSDAINQNKDAEMCSKHVDVASVENQADGKMLVDDNPVKPLPQPLFPSALAIQEHEKQLQNTPPQLIPPAPEMQSILSSQQKVAPPFVINPPPPEKEIVMVEDLLLPPGRYGRPSKIVIIVRGLPGSGKSHLARLIKEKEVLMGGSAPRILSIDDYYLVDDGSSPIPWQEDQEEQYRQSLLKSLRRNLDEGHFSFIIIDAPHIKITEISDVQSAARSRAFAVFLVDLPDEGRPGVTRKCTKEDYEKMKKDWEQAPDEIPHLDVRWLFHETDDRTSTPENAVSSTTVLVDEDSRGSSTGTPAVSKWEMMEQTDEKLDRLDGVVKRRSEKVTTVEDWLQTGLPDDYENRKCTEGKKRVRWADVEEKMQQQKMRDVGFVVGQTDWSRMTDPTFGESALTKTKYI